MHCLRQRGRMLDGHAGIGEGLDDVQGRRLAHVIRIGFKGQSPQGDCFVFWSALFLEVLFDFFASMPFCRLLTASTAATRSGVQPYSLAVLIRARTSFGKQDPP